MNILALSDIHGNIESLERIIQKIGDKIREKIDVIIISGDITHFGNLNSAIEIIRPLKKICNKILFIPGNCDFFDSKDFKNEHEFVNLHTKRITINDFNFFGFGGSSPTPFSTLFEFSEEEISDKLSSILSDHHKGEKWITVTHDAPFNSNIDLNRRGNHVGSRAIREFILKFKPIIHISGHIHEAKGKDKLEDTLLINPGNAANGNYALIRIHENKIEAILDNIYD